jgi:hypothetical protein
VRRAFLKAIGMAHNCGWPASPLVFNPTDVAVASSAWTKPGDQAGLQMLAIATPAPLAVPPVTQAPASDPSPKVMLASANFTTTRPASNARVITTRTVAVQTIAVQTTKSPMAPPQMLASSAAAAPVLAQRVVTVSAAETIAPGSSDASTTGYYTAPSTYVAPTATAAAFASSAPSAPWSTPQR